MEDAVERAVGKRALRRRGEVVPLVGGAVH